MGESAHVNPPWGGHGFNTSVGDAVNIAWKIAAVLHGWAPERLLASYEPERRGVVEKTVASAASHLSNMAGDLPQDEASIQQRRAPSSTAWPGPRLLLRGVAGHPAVGRPARGHRRHRLPPTTDPGARLPHWWLPDGSSLYDHLGPGFTLLCRAHDADKNGAPARWPSPRSDGAPAPAASR